MKKLLVVFIALFLLGHMPKEVWEKGTPQQQMGFAQMLMENFAPTIGCIEGDISVVPNEDKVFFIFNCDKFKEDKADERITPSPKVAL